LLIVAHGGSIWAFWKLLIGAEAISGELGDSMGPD
jgi:hypothetical protein